MAGDEQLTSTSEAQQRLGHVPAGVMRDTVRQRVERLARQRGLSAVTVDLLEDKYRQWAQGSAQATSEMTWTDEARERMERVPAFVRGMVTKAIEAYARQHGLAEIAQGPWMRRRGFGVWRWCARNISLVVM